MRGAAVGMALGAIACAEAYGDAESRVAPADAGSDADVAPPRRLDDAGLDADVVVPPDAACVPAIDCTGLSDTECSTFDDTDGNFASYLEGNGDLRYSGTAARCTVPDTMSAAAIGRSFIMGLPNFELTMRVRPVPGSSRELTLAAATTSTSALRVILDGQVLRVCSGEGCAGALPFSDDGFHWIRWTLTEGAQSALRVDCEPEIVQEVPPRSVTSIYAGVLVSQKPDGRVELDALRIRPL